MSMFKGRLPQFVNPLAIAITMGIAFIGWTSSPAHSSTLNIQANILLGVNGLNVGGTNYNVLFVDNTCVVAFAGCSTNLNFDFQNQMDADAAAQALLNSISGSAFDAPPSQVFGLGSPSFGDVYIPYNHAVIAETDKFGAPTTREEVTYAGFTFPGTFSGITYPLTLITDRQITPIINLATNNFAVYADFTVVSPVPVPAALPLFGSGLAIMGFIGWRRKRKLATAA